MATLTRPRTYVLLAVVLLFGTACRDVSQPAIDSPGAASLFPVEENGKWGYVDGSGDLVIEPQYDHAYPFYDDRALIRQGNHFGFIDASGSAVTPTKYSRAWHFSGGVAPIQQDSLWGFIDRTGRIVVEPRFTGVYGPPNPSDTSYGAKPPSDSASHLPVAPSVAPTASYFSENLAPVRSGEKWGYIDRQGSTVIPPQFSSATSFREGLARVTFTDNQMGYVNRDGTVIWPPNR